MGSALNTTGECARASNILCARAARQVEYSLFAFGEPAGGRVGKSLMNKMQGWTGGRTNERTPNASLTAVRKVPERVEDVEWTEAMGRQGEKEGRKGDEPAIHCVLAVTRENQGNE